MTISALPCGQVRGEQGRGVVHFRGLPYASAARFGQPVRLAPWDGLRDATRHGPIPPQPPSRLRAAMGDFERPRDEDCLTLTIATPAVDAAARPVLVFLHGGAYWTGAGSLDWYDGAVLAAENGCVVVGVNYRLGALGFLTHPEVAPANLGLADMVTALGWVRDNIAAFGGDPGCVTLVGQSAGAHAIMMLLADPASAGLFHRGVLMSAPADLAPKTVAAATRDAEFLAATIGVPVAGLAHAPVAALLDAGMKLARAGARFADATPPFYPVDDALSDPAAFVATVAREAAARGVALVIGTTREEMHAFFVPDPAMDAPDPAQVAACAARIAGDAGAIEAYRERRPGASDRDVLGDLVTDAMFLRPSIALAEALTAAGGHAHVYQFDAAGAGNGFMACHCIELPFLFGNFDAWSDAAMLRGFDPAQMQAISAQLRAAVAGFAHGRPPWPCYDNVARTTMVFGTISGPCHDPAGATWRRVFRPHTENLP